MILCSDRELLKQGRRSCETWEKKLRHLTCRPTGRFSKEMISSIHRKLDIGDRSLMLIFLVSVFRTIETNSRTWSAWTCGRGCSDDRIFSIGCIVIYYRSFLSRGRGKTCDVSEMIMHKLLLSKLPSVAAV